MGVVCVILNQTDCDTVKGGAEKGYLNGAQCNPAQRTGGTSGNPDPCYILNSVMLSNPDFVAAQPYLSGLTQKDSSDPGFPPPFVR